MYGNMNTPFEVSTHRIVEFMSIKIVLLTFLLLINCQVIAKTSIEPDSTKTVKIEDEPEEEEVYEPFLRVYLGGFHAASKTSLFINSSMLGKGTTIDPEEALGIDEKKIIPRAEVIFNPGKRHEIGFTYWTIRRSNTRILDRDIQFGDATFSKNSSVTSKFNTTNYALTYRFSIFVDQHWDAGASIGGKIIDFDTRINANLNGNSYSKKNRTYAPVPLLGIHGGYKSGKHFIARGTAEFFTLNISEWDFSMIDARIGMEYYPIRHLGIGIDYHFFDTRIDKVPSGKLDGQFKYRFNAVSLYLALRI